MHRNLALVDADTQNIFADAYSVSADGQGVQGNRALVNTDTQDVLADADDVLADRCVVYSNSALVNADRRDVCRHISRDLALIGAQTYIVGACCCGNSLDSE